MMKREMQEALTAKINWSKLLSTFLDEFRRAIKAKHGELTQQCV